MLCGCSVVPHMTMDPCWSCQVREFPQDAVWERDACDDSHWGPMVALWSGVDSEVTPSCTRLFLQSTESMVEQQAHCNDGSFTSATTNRDAVPGSGSWGSIHMRTVVPLAAYRV